MSVVKVGGTYRVLYEAKNLSTGLDNIFATIRRPDGVKVGPVQLSEEIIPELLGNYSYDLLIPTNAPVGEWTGTIFSTDENVKSSFRFSVQDESSGSVSGASNDDDAILVIENNSVSIDVEKIELVEVNIQSELAEIKVSSESAQMSIQSDSADILINDLSVELAVNCEEL